VIRLKQELKAWLHLLQKNYGFRNSLPLSMKRANLGYAMKLYNKYPIKDLK
jgi:hypothetical protein